MQMTGHVVIGQQGELIGVDDAFCALMHASAQEMQGRLVLDVTAPADRDECSLAIATLRETRRPFEIVKRFLRDDGTLVWVRNRVSITADGAMPDTIVATIEPVEGADERSPATLLDCARFLLTLNEDRDQVCDPSLFSDVVWSTMLVLYVAEAEGEVLDTRIVAERLSRPYAIMGRWMRALLHHGVVEIETRDPRPDTPKMYRLTGEAHRRLETYLGRVKPRWQSIMTRR